MIDSSGIHRGEPVCAADEGFPFPPAPLRPQAALMTLPSLDKIKQEEEEKKKKKDFERGLIFLCVVFG